MEVSIVAKAKESKTVEVQNQAHADCVLQCERNCPHGVPHKEGDEKEDGILLALGALLPMILKALPLILGAGAAASISHSVNQKRHDNKIEDIARDKGNGFYLDTHQGKSIRYFMKNAIDDAADIANDVKKYLKSTIKNMKDGSFAEFKDGKLSFELN